MKDSIILWNETYQNPDSSFGTLEVWAGVSGRRRTWPGSEKKMVQIIFEFWIIHDNDDFVSSAAIWDYFATVSLTGKWMIMLPMKVVIVVDTSVAVEATGIVVTWTQLNPGKGLGREGWVFASSGLVTTTRSPLSPLHLYRYLDFLPIWSKKFKNGT